MTETLLADAIELEKPFRLDDVRHRRTRFLTSHSDESGTARTDVWQRSIEHLRRMRVSAREVRPAPAGAPAPTTFAGVSWTQIGPCPIRVDSDQIFQGSGPDAGEVTDIVIDPRGTEDQTIYITTNNGGVWKTTDGGATWSPRTDLMPSLSMGAIALDPADPDTVYAGTGNEFDGGNLFNKGVGIYRSIDAGATWTQFGQTVLGGRQITRMVLPSSGVLLVATDNGLYRSVDGGASFGNNAPAFDNGNPVLPGDVDDLALDKSDPSIVYACVDGQGILVSTDSGITYPTNLFSNTGAPAAPFDRISLAQSVQPDANTMYALVTDNSATPAFKGLYRSTDHGLSWTLLPDAQARATENQGLQAEYDLTIGVDPADATRVYMGFQELYLSTNSGDNFGTPATSQNKIHWDHHIIVFSPHHSGGAPTPLYVGTDGGIARSDNGGALWTNLNETIATNLFIGIDIGRNSVANNRYTFGGTQDTGTLEHRPEFPGLDWHLGRDGDGGPVAVDTNNPLRVYGHDDGLFITTSDGGTNWSFPPAATTKLPADGSGRSRGTPRGVDLNSSAVVYVSEGADLYRSTDTGSTFVLVHSFPATVTAFANVKLDSKVLMVGCQDGSVHRTTNADAGTAAAWNALVVTDAPALPVGAIAIDPSDVLGAVIGYNGLTGINPANRTKHVFRTTDGGTSFNDISGTDGGSVDDNLPDLPIHSAVIDASTAPSGIIVATDSAVLRSTDGGATWQIYGVGVPGTDCLSLAVDHSASPPVLRLGTYGRSCFELQRLGGPRIFVRSNMGFGNVAQGSNSDLTFDIFNIGDADLSISAIADSLANPNYALVSPPAFPLTIPPGTQSTLTVRFAPTAGGKQITAFSITSNDLTTPVASAPVSGVAPSTGPQVTSVVPPTGIAAGGTTVEVLGTGLTGATAVMFGAAAAASLTVDSDTHITVVSPAGAGSVDVTVITPSGTTSVTPADRFTYLGAGTVVTGLNPKEGPETGGTPVTITGTGFTGATQVLFGAFATSSFTVDSDTQITSVSPAGTGTVDVLVATPSGTSPVSSADRFRYNPGTGGTSTGTTGTTTTTTTTTGGTDAESNVMQALADILRTGTDPDILEAQRTLLRRIALEGNIIDSRVPAPKNITEIGGYINLLGSLGATDIRTQMLASVLGVAGPATPVGLSSQGTALAFVTVPNDRPAGAFQPTLTTAITVRSDMADAFAQALQRIHGLGCALPLYTPPRVLPQATPGQQLQLDFLLILGRVLQVAPTVLLTDPATDPIAIARRASDPPAAFQLVARELDTANRVAQASWVAFQATDAGAAAQPPAQRQYVPLNPILADAGWYPVQPVVLPGSSTQPGSLPRFINVAGLMRGQTHLGDELSLLYPIAVIMGSALAGMLSWVWNGTTFVPPLPGSTM
jgi:photosystem II stability/assembly factor-like uncharacterized protein